MLAEEMENSIKGSKQMSTAISSSYEHSNIRHVKVANQVIVKLNNIHMRVNPNPLIHSVNVLRSTLSTWCPAINIR